MLVATETFAGMLPRYQSFVLPKQNSQLSINANLVSGGLETFRADVPVMELDYLYSDMFRYTRGSRYNVANDPLNGTKQWLFFKEHVKVVPLPTYDDVSSQMLITSSAGFRMFDSNTLDPEQNTITTSNSILTGINTVAQPNLSRVAGSSTIANESRSYVVCLVRQWQSGKLDLGGPSLPAIQSDGKTYIDMENGYVPQIRFTRPVDYTTRGITHAYVYRTTVTTEGEVDYRLVIIIDIRPGAPLPDGVTMPSEGLFQFIDNVPTLNLQETMASTTWDAPPDNLQGVISLRNGILAGFLNKTVYISEPNMPHAWPEIYRIPTDYEIVGLGSFGNTLVICTKGYTFMCVLTNPENALLIPIQEAIPCVSARSIVNTSTNVLYASKLGIVSISGAGSKLITKDLITDREWEYYNPNTMRATQFQNRYATFFDAQSFEIQGFVVDFEEPSIGLQGVSTYVDAMWYDDTEDTVFVIYKHPITNKPFLMRFAEGSPDSRNMLWRSKLYFSDQGLFNFAAGKINFYDDSKDNRPQDFAYIPSSNAFNVNPVNIYPIAGDANTNARNIIDRLPRSTRFRLYINDSFRFMSPIYNNRAFRLPAGFRGDSYYFEIEGTLPIKRVQMASSMGELT